MRYHSTIPVLRIFDMQKMQEFYIDFLGFQIDWKHQFEEAFPYYLQISKDECVLHLSEHFGDATPGASIRIATDDVILLSRQLNHKNYRHSHPGTEEKPWGSIEMTIYDPFGNRLTFHSPVSI